MTIFRKVIEAFLIEGIERIQTISEGYDNGTLNRVRGFTFWSGRDLELSAQKRTRLSLLITQIKALEQTEDQATKDALLGLLIKCKQDLLDICTAKKRTTGSTEIAVTDLHAFVGAAEAKICDDLTLRDAVADDKAINKFNYYCAKAYGRSVYEQYCLKSAETLMLNHAKEAIILDTLVFAAAINKTASVAKTKQSGSLMTKEQYRQLIAERAGYIQREVQKVDQNACNAYVIEYMNEAIHLFKPPVIAAPIAVATTPAPAAIVEAAPDTNEIPPTVLTA